MDEKPARSGPQPDGSLPLAPRSVWISMGVGIVVALALLIAIIVWGPPLLVQQGKATNDAYLKAITDTRTALVQAAGGFALLLGVVVGVFTLAHNRQQLQASRQEHIESLDASRQAFQATLAVTERGQITDRFTKAIEQLGRSGSDAISLRLGGVYALERIAQDSPRDHGPIVEVLSAFLRDQSLKGNVLVAFAGQERPDEHVDSGWLPKEHLRPDLQAAVTVLGRRNTALDYPGEWRLDLHQVDLRRGDLRRVNFQRALLWGVHLQGANVTVAQLDGADFAGADLETAALGSATLQRCLFSEANLENASLYGADLRGAQFLGSNLKGAVLTGAHTEDASFSGANMQGAYLKAVDLSEARNLIQVQVDSAITDENTILPPRSGLT